MKRMALVLIAWFSLANLVAAPASEAQQPAYFPAPVPSVDNVEVKPAKTAPPALSPSPGETPEARAHEEYLLRMQAAEESVIRAAKARAEQRTRRLESRRWFGISNQRPAVSTDPYNGDYAPHWVGNDPGLPNRWVGAGQPWGGSGE